MYPRNAASPERVPIGPVVQISDGAVQSSGVSVSVLPMGGASGAGAGTVGYENGVVVYTPVQSETNYTSVVLVAYKTGCIPACTGVVFSAAPTVGQVYPDASSTRVAVGMATANLDTQLTALAAIPLDATETQAAAAAAIADDKTGYSLAATGLDAIADPDDLTPGVVPTTFTQKIRWLIQRFWKSKRTATAIEVYNEAGSLITSQDYTVSGYVQDMDSPD